MKKRLFTPGPTPVPEQVMLTMADPLIHHRSPEFREIMSRVNANLRYLFQTSQPVLTLACSGTGGVESTFVSLFSPGETVIAVNGGKFGERWVEMPRVFGLNAVEIALRWGTALREEQLRDTLRAHPEAKAVYLTQSETSTGTLTDVRTMARVIHEYSSALVCVDGISSIGAQEMRFDEWGVDVCVTGSQKGLMIPPGLAFVALSARAREAVAKSSMPRFYFDLQRALRSYEKDDTPWTPAISLIIGADLALEMIRKEGVEQVWLRHQRLGSALRAGVLAVGLKLFSEAPTASVTAVCIPEGMAWKDFNRALKIDNGVTVAGGQGDFAGKIFRVSHLGYYDELDMVACMAAIERALVAVGYAFTHGAGVEAVHKELLKSEKEPHEDSRQRPIGTELHRYPRP
jgi:serine---pyruvate transaminase